MALGAVVEARPVVVAAAEGLGAVVEAETEVLAVCVPASYDAGSSEPGVPSGDRGSSEQGHGRPLPCGHVQGR